MAFKYRIAALVVLLPLSACAWVKLTPAADDGAQTYPVQER